MPNREWFDAGGDFFESIITAVYSQLVKTGDIVVDVGASHGLHTFPLADLVGSSGRVVAIEPIPALADALRRRSAGRPHVRVINKALSHARGAADFCWVRGGDGYSGLRRRTMPQELGPTIASIRVATTTLDQELLPAWWSLTKRRPVRFIKMDIEGGEFHALSGARRLLAMDKPVIVFENGGAQSAALYGYTREQFFDLFDRLHYQVYDIFGERLAPEVWGAPGIPWYCVAVPAGGDAGHLVDQLPALVQRLFLAFRRQRHRD